MRKVLWAAALLFVTASSALPQEGAINARPDLPIDQEHTQWIEHVMHAIGTIKPGMTRGELHRVFTDEGGLSTRSQRRYVYKHSPYIKVDIQFSPIDEGANESPNDKIVKISRPFLEYPISD